MINVLKRSRLILHQQINQKGIPKCQVIQCRQINTLLHKTWNTFCDESNKKNNQKDNNQKKSQKMQQNQQNNSKKGTLVSKVYMNQEKVELRDDDVQSVPVRNIKIKAERELKLKKYLLYNSSQALIPYHSMQMSFQKGKVNQDSLKKRVIFNLMNDENNEVNRVGLVLADSVNMQMKKQIQKMEDKRDPNSYFHNYSFHLNEMNMNIDLKTRTDSYRVKIYQIENGTNGIYAYCEKYEDEEQELDNEKIKQQLYVIQTMLLNIQKNQLKVFKKSIFTNSVEENRFQLLYENEFEIEKVDRLIYDILNQLSNVNYQVKLYQKEDKKRVQEILECRSLDARLQTIIRHLESVIQTLDELQEYDSKASIGNQTLTQKQKAMIGVQYLEKFYKLDQSSINMMNMNMEDETITGYLNKLHLIKGEQNREKILKEIEKLQSMDKYQGEYSKTLTYLDEVFSIPWNKYAKEEWDASYTRKVLDENIYGLEKVKQRIIEMVAVNKVKRNQEQIKNDNMNDLAYKKKGVVILLYGPPGIGKTSIAKLIAKSLKRNYRLISLAGVNDANFMKGHRRTYVDSQPGVFIKELIKGQQMNSVFILDEMDKISNTGRGNPYYSLMEILNPEESHNFVDHYLDIKVDFSEVIFILTANSVINMLEPLKNRLEIIQIPAYIDEEKINIFQQYLLPKVVQEHGLKNGMVKFDDQTVKLMIKGWSYYESGVRGLTRSLQKITRKYAVQVVQSLQSNIDQQNKNNNDNNKDDNENNENNNDIAIELEHNQHLIKPLEFYQSSDTKLVEYLGPMQFNMNLESMNKKQTFRVGTLNVLYVSTRQFIGWVGKVECIFNDLYNKKGITSSGNLKTLLKESLQVAEYNLKKYLKPQELELWNSKSVHIHFGDSSTGKDGTSCGTTIVMALLGLIRQKNFRTNLALTGELTLSGKILAINGVQEKMIAAKSVGINVLVVPYLNRSDVLNLPKQLLNGTTVFAVSSFDHIYQLVFEQSLESYNDFLVIQNGEIVNSDEYDTIINHLFGNDEKHIIMEPIATQPQERVQQSMV